VALSVLREERRKRNKEVRSYSPLGFDQATNLDRDFQQVATRFENMPFSVALTSRDLFAVKKKQKKKKKKNKIRYERDSGRKA
jgi:hypothetical protein